ncbi:Anaphase-promoting complex subunit 4 [Mortierella alpina]|nr:Anaphase-promoting complex subunit 4 [Mortierella alpina]
MQPGPQDQQAPQQDTPQPHFDPSFDLYSEKQFPTAHRFAAWSPTADLIAIVNHQNDLDLYRLSWQRHWSVPVTSQPQAGLGQGFRPATGVTGHGFAAASGGLGGGLLRYHRSSATTSLAPKADVVSLAWRPDGKMIAVGLSSGTVNVHDYRDGSLAYVISPSEEHQLVSGMTPTKASARCLRWADIYLGQTSQTPLFGAHQTPKTILEVLPLLSPIPQSSTQQQLLKARSMFKNNGPGLSGTGNSKSGEILPENIHVTDEESSDIMNVLFVGNDHGWFTLRLYGGFETDSISLPKLLDAYGVKGYKTLNILKTDIRLDLSQLTVVAVGSRPEAAEDKSPVESRILQISLSSDLLYSHSREVRMLGLKKRPVNYLLNYLTEAFEVMNAEYTKISLLTENCVESVQQNLTDNGGELLLDERPVYNCIKLVGDFMGCIEQLLQALKVELKQFSEFENWMEQVIEMLQPTLKGADDQGEEGPKTFPPVDVLSVSEYLKSGLTNKCLREFFIESENLSTPSSDVDNMDFAGKQHHAKADEKEAPMSQMYQESPSYPIVYSFAEELDTIPLKHGVCSDTSKAKQEEQQPQKKANNPFAGPAIKAALAGRGFGLLPSKKSSSSALFARSGSSSPLPFDSEKNDGVEATSQQKSRRNKRRPSLTMKKHLELMDRHCQEIFKGPATAVAKSMRVVNTLNLLDIDMPLLERTKVENLEAKEGEHDDMTQYLKLATRYCYHTSKPWHYTAVYLAPDHPRAQPSLWILRTRNRSAAPSASTISPDIDESPSSSQESAVSSTSKESQPQTSPRESPTAPRIKQGRKRTASDEAPPTLAPQFKTRTKSFLKAPSSSQAASRGLDEITNRNNFLIDDRIEQDIEIAVFSLQEQGTAMPYASLYSRSPEEETDPLAIARAGWSQQPSDLELTPIFEIRDLIFLDDDNVGVLLNSSLSRPSATASGRTGGAEFSAGEASTFVHDEQYLVSVPLHSPGRPYQRLQEPRHHPASPSKKPNHCLLDRLVQNLMAEPTDAEHSSSTTRLSPTLYTLPISRSRRVTQFGDHSAARAEMMSSSAASASGPSDPMPRSGQPSSSVSKPAAALTSSSYSSSSSFTAAVPPAVATVMRTRAREQDLIGPCRIASNEREKGRVVSVHGPSHEGASTLQGAGKITVFEL